MRERFFPIDRIKHNSRVILYGAGVNARDLYEMNEKIKWCKIIGAIDKNAKKIQDFPVNVVTPESTNQLGDFDYILITILNPKIREEVSDYLENLGFSKEVIISDIDCTFGRDDCAPVIAGDNKPSGKKLSIALWPKGTIGDHVIFLKMYQEIVRLAPSANITILEEFKGFPESILYNQKNLYEIRLIDQFFCEWEEYDLVLFVRFEPKVLYVDLKKLKRLSLPLYKAINKLIEYQKYDQVELPYYQYENRILADRAKFLGLNHYTLFNISGAFEGITDQSVDLYINESYEAEFRKLKLKKPYVTYNYGAGNALGSGKPQVKQWPYDYHVEFNRIFKEKYPNIDLIQVGGKDVVKIPGADRYILGKHFDVVKYILKNSLFHFDCEGGLVHIASQLGTKCFVVFGPTPAWFLGYENNENIEPKVCGGCKGLIKDWYIRCYKYERPECMYSIKPEDVLERMTNYLESIKYI